MPRKSEWPPVPKVRGGKDVLRLRSGGKVRQITLGPAGSPEAKAAYVRILAEIETHGRAIERSTSLRLAELVDQYMDVIEKEAEPRTYRRAKRALRGTLALYGPTPAAEFGPLALKTVRAAWENEGTLSRAYINKLTAAPDVDRLDEDEKTYIRRTDVGLSPGRDLVYLAEQGLYTVLVRSDKPAAKPFRKWVCGDVLPCIRKHGCYPAPTAIVPVASPAREPMEVVRGFLETCTNILGLGGMDDRDRIILKDFARNRLLLDANCSAPNRRFHSIVDRAMTIGYPRLRSPPRPSLSWRFLPGL